MEDIVTPELSTRSGMYWSWVLVGVTAVTAALSGLFFSIHFHFHGRMVFFALLLLIGVVVVLFRAIQKGTREDRMYSVLVNTCMILFTAYPFMQNGH